MNELHQEKYWVKLSTEDMQFGKRSLSYMLALHNSPTPWFSQDSSPL